MTLPDAPGRMIKQINTLLDNGNGSHTLDLDRIARFQGFSPDDFRTAFLRAETAASLSPAQEVTDE